MSLRPSATMLLQLRSGVAVDPDPNSNFVPALELHMPDALDSTGTYFEGNVESVTTTDGTSCVAGFKAYNLSRETIDKIDPAGFIQVIAGYYPGPENAPPPQTLFYGKIQESKYFREGGESVLEFSATSFPQDMLDVIVPLSIKGDSTAGDVIRKLCAGVGLSVGFLDAAFDGFPNLAVHPNWPEGAHILTDYSSSLGVGSEISSIVGAINARTGGHFGQVPNVSEPLTIEIIDLDDTTGEEDLFLDLDGPFIMSAGPMTGTKAVDATISSSGSATTDSQSAKVQKEAAAFAVLDSLTAVQGFHTAMVFDPRLAPGMFAIFKGTVEGEGKFRIDSVRHDMGNEWVTNIQGQYVNGTFYKPLVSNTAPEAVT